MPLFLGEFVHQVDEKRRLSIPARFRDLIAKDTESPYYVLPGLDPCLYVMSEAQVARLLDRLSLERAEWSPFGRSFRSMITSGMTPLVLDSQGRVGLTERQLEYAGLDAHGIVVGNADRIEIWQEQQYRRHLERPRAESFDMSKLAEMFLREPGASAPPEVK